MSTGNTKQLTDSGLSHGAFECSYLQYLNASESGHRPSAEVDLTGDRLKVIGIATGTDSAKMVKLKAIGDWTMFPLIHLNMSGSMSAITPRRGELTVSGTVESKFPNPAWRCVATILDHVINRRKPTMMSGQELDRTPLDDAVLPIISFGDRGRTTTATAAKPCGVWLVERGNCSQTSIAGSATDGIRSAKLLTTIRTITGRLCTRHSLASLSGLGVRRARSVDALPGFALSQL